MIWFTFTSYAIMFLTFTSTMMMLSVLLLLLVEVESKPFTLPLISKFGVRSDCSYNNKQLWRRNTIVVNVPRSGGVVDGIDRIQSHNAAKVDTAATVGIDTLENTKELSLDEKVYAAMKKLGLDPPTSNTRTSNETPNTDATVPGVTTTESSEAINDSLDPTTKENNASECPDGLCEVRQHESTETTGPDDQSTSSEDVPLNDPNQLAGNISKKMNVDLSMAWAALGATSTATENNKRIYNEQAACEMIQMELDMISKIQEDSDDVALLVKEGYSPFFVRRALAFTERNVDDARAILLADKMDEEEEETVAAEAAAQAEASARKEEKKQLESSFKTVNVKADFDPTKLGPTKEQKSAPSPPEPASRESVIFEASAAQIQELVLESPVPVLLDIYADWCGPCKALSPILEDMAIKSGGTLRLVKVNSDNERAISQALEVTALPTIFGIRDGKIRHMFQGMPKSEEMMKNFLMGLMIPGHPFNPPLTDLQQQKYSELSGKLMKVAVTASFPFAARERLHDRINAQIDNLVQQTGNVLDAEQAVITIRSLVTNIIRDPYEVKFRKINLSNKVIATKVAQYPACLAMLKSVGFGKIDSSMIIGKDKPFVNTAPLTVLRDTIDKWVDRTRYEVAREARKRRDEEDRIRIQAELAAMEEIEPKQPNESEEKEVDPDACIIKFRIDGKKKMHVLSLHADDPLSTVLDRLPEGSESLSKDGGHVLLTCVARRLVVKSTDHIAMKKSLRDHGLVPTANIVIKFTTTEATEDINPEQKSVSKLASRAASKKKLKKGSHTMQSIGIYSTQDNAKGELIDGGGGTWYEHDVSDDEVESTTTNDKSDDDDGDDAKQVDATTAEDGEVDETFEESL